MATKRVIGFIISLALIISPQAVRAQEEIPVDPAPVESPVSQPTQEGEGYSEPEQEDVNVADSENQSDASSPDPVVDGNGSGYLASAGMTLEEFVMKDPTEEEVNALSDVDRQAWEQAKENGIVKSTLTTDLPENLGFVPEQAVVKDCSPERFVSCTGFIFTTIKKYPGKPTKFRSVHLKVKNLMMDSAPFITAIVTAKLIKNDPSIPQESITARLTDQDKDPLSATFTIYTHKLDTENYSHVSSEGITVPLPLEDETKPDVTRHIEQSLHITGVVPSENSNLIDFFAKSEGKNGKIRCGKAWASSNIENCVNPFELPTITFDANDGFPYIARNIHDAIEKDERPSVLTRDNTVAQANRIAACRGSGRARLGDRPSSNIMPNPTCDEYPFVSTKEGGKETTVAWVPASENSRQGGVVVQFLKKNQVRNDDQFVVEAIV